MSRRFDGIDDVVSWENGAGGPITTAFTFAVVVKLDAGVSWQALLSSDESGAARNSMGRWASGEIAVHHTGGAGGSSKSIGMTHSSSDGWHLAVVRKATGTSTPTFTKYPIGGAPTHQAGDAAIATNNDPDQDEYRFGAIDGTDWFDGWLAVAAVWHSTQLSQANVESLVTSFTRTHWLSLSPSGLWDELDGFATDHSGNGATRIALAGTTDDADDPTGWNLWEGITPPVDYDYSRFPKPKLRELANR